MNFKTYVEKHARITHDAAGDFVEDARHAMTKPEFYGEFPVVDDFESVRAHIRNRTGSNEGAVEGAKVVWKRYQSWLTRHAA